MLYPIMLEPVFKEYLWGGKKLIEKYNKDGGKESIAESWELSVHPQGVCSVANGRFAGMPFPQYLTEVSGALGESVRELPLLVKYIDSADRLSVQVHPNDSYAMQKHGCAGKTEFWYIMDCEPDAEIFYGLSRSLSREEFCRMAEDGSIVEALRRVKVNPGDAFLLPPGMVHAIGGNMTVAEIGTNCNITYRIFDYGRLDAAGARRSLHIENAADVIKNDESAAAFENGRMDCGAFKVEILDVNGIVDVAPNNASFQCLLCVEGSCRVDRAFELTAGSSAFIPAGLAYTLNGRGRLLRVTV